jgi:microsomal dipeptidase-like Zn-dependent dipeptidase
MRRLLFVLAIVVLVLFVSAPWIFRAVDRITNRVSGSPHPVDASASSLHDSLWIADFHNDALLWNRDLNRRATHGHVDIPRLLDGGFELAVFSAVTRYPVASNYHRTPGIGDVMPFAAIARGWPHTTWSDPNARALMLAAALHEAEAMSSGRLRIVRSREELHALLQSQADGDSVVGALLLLEGMHSFDGRIGAIDPLFAAGYRVFGIAHMFDNDIGGSAHGWRKGGLTALGRRAVARIDSLGGIIDLAHASRATIDDVLALSSRPVVISHTGVTSACAGPRNPGDDIVKRIAARGGLIGIGFWDAAVCGDDPAAIARAIAAAVALAGIEHVALGSDFDGAVRVPFDAAHIDMLTAALIDEGLTHAQIRAVMGENQRRFLLDNLPAR